MGLVNGIRTINQLMAGSMDATALQTHLGTAANYGSLCQVLSMRAQSEVVLNNAAALTALSGSALGTLAVAQSNGCALTVAPFRATPRPYFIGLFAANGKIGIVQRTGTSITVNENQWMVAPLGSGYIAFSSATQWYTSPDGITWTLGAIPIGTPNWQGCFFSYAGGYTFFGGYDATLTQCSQNPSIGGAAFTYRTINSTSTRGSNVAYGAGTYCCALNGGVINAYTTTPGGAWTVGTAMPTSGDWGMVAFGNSVFTFFRKSSAVGATSANGQTWTTRASGFPSLAYPQCVFGNGVFVACAYKAVITSVYTSTDGYTWTTRTIPSRNAGTLMFGSGAFVMSSNDTTSPILVSTDGINWTGILPPVPGLNTANGCFHPTKGEFLFFGTGATTTMSFI